MALRKGWPVVAGRLLQISKTIEKRLWGYENPLRQFDILSYEILNKIENRGLTVDHLKELDHKEIGKYQLPVYLITHHNFCLLEWLNWQSIGLGFAPATGHIHHVLIKSPNKLNILFLAINLFM